MDKIKTRIRKKKSIRAKIFGTKMRPRLSVYRSNRYIYAQIINDEQGATLVAISTKEKEEGSKKDTKLEVAEAVGQQLAKKALKKKIKKIAFDRNGYKYHGRVKSLAEGARKGGLKF